VDKNHEINMLESTCHFSISRKDW